MPEVWQTIEQAAVTLGLSVRTVNRHITGGKLESRLFEGRREVLVSLPDPVKVPDPVKPSATSTRPTAAPAESTVNFTMGSAAPSSAASASAEPSPAAPAYDSVRRAMFANDTDEKPLDLRTMLTLADSADDKASLAVAAYQTLAHTAEIQVQSLRRVALGAWAAVGLMAAGAIVAVGWGTYRLTSAEGTASYLRNQVSEQKGEIGQLTNERDRVKSELVKVQIESARLQDRLSQLADAQSVAEIARFALRNLKQAEAAAPGTQPVIATQPSVASTTQPATQPVAAVPHPGTQPASKPAMTGQKPTYMTNSREPFDPR